MLRKLKIAGAVVAVMAAGLTAAEAVRYEAQDAVITPEQKDPYWDEHVPEAGSVEEDASASGGQYVKMRDSGLEFTVDAPAAGDYAIVARYSQTYGESKQQNLTINGASAGSVTFLATGAIDGPLAWETITIGNKVRLNAGSNKVALTRSWGWVDIDWIEIAPYEDEAFDIKAELVTPNASESAREVYQFMRENFTKKIISGVMTGYGIHANSTYQTETEVEHIYNNSGKYPALLGFDFFHGTGHQSNDSWFISYNNGVLAMAEQIFNAGGIPHLMWHWKDPNNDRQEDEDDEKLFYSRYHSGYNTVGTRFDLGQAFTNSSHTTWDEDSDEYKNILADIDRVSGYLKALEEKGVAVLWRPLHEAAGGWFWWGAAGKTTVATGEAGAARARANKELWILMFDRMVNHHGLKNLIWVYTCEEGRHGEDPTAWYPGDEYVDIIGRDIYANTGDNGSLVSNFINLKNMYNGDKIIALSENGPIPHPNNLVTDGAGWSFFMTWNSWYTTDQNTAAHWNAVMNHDYVLTLDKMPGWSSSTSVRGGATVANRVNRAPVATVRGRTLSVVGIDNSEMTIRLINVNGRVAARFNATGSARFSLAKVPAGRYIVETKIAGKRVGSAAVVVK